MRYLVSGKEMKLLDQNTSVSLRVPELVLMEQAAMAFVQRLFGIQNNIESALIVCGSGNNGADGLAIARLLHERGVAVTALLAGEAGGHKTTNSYKVQKQICEAYELTLVESQQIPQEDYALIVDAIFGIGLSRNITGAFATLLDAMNEKAAWRVAVDIASGIDAESGAVLGSAFCADDTITFAYGKVGQYLWPGSDFSGRISVVPMGITKASWLDKKPRLAVLEESDLSWLPARSDHTNKGSYGRLLIIAGSVNMAGAAVLAAKAAYRTGCGLVKVMTPEENRTIVQTAVPEALFATYGLEFDEEQVIEELKWADAVVLGPGIGTDRQAQRIVDLTLHHCEVPLLVDADALNLIAQTPALLSEPHTDMIVTPHLGEMARLTGDTVALLQSRLIESARNFAQTYDVICVLKDFRTVTSEPYGLDYLNLSGNHGMATAGSGDVLSGVIGSLLAQGMRPEKAAPLGVYLHGLAGDAAVQTCTRRALMASDIIEGLRGILS